MPALMMQPDLSNLVVSGPVRNAALTAWQQQGWPGPRVESWRFTKLDRLGARDITPALSLSPTIAGNVLAMAQGMGAHAIRIINGIIDPASLGGLPAGLTAGNLHDDQDAQNTMMALAPPDHPVSNLSMAVMRGGLVLDVTGEVAQPLALIFEGDDAGLSAHPVVLIRLAPAAQMAMAEWHQSAVPLSAPLIGLDLAAKASLDFVKIQSDGSVTFVSPAGEFVGEWEFINGKGFCRKGKFAGADIPYACEEVKLVGERIFIFVNNGKADDPYILLVD